MQPSMCSRAWRRAASVAGTGWLAKKLFTSSRASAVQKLPVVANQNAAHLRGELGLHLLPVGLDEAPCLDRGFGPFAGRWRAGWRHPDCAPCRRRRYSRARCTARDSRTARAAEAHRSGVRGWWRFRRSSATGQRERRRRFAPRLRARSGREWDRRRPDRRGTSRRSRAPAQERWDPLP